MLRAAAREAAHHGDRQRNAHRARGELVKDEADHLREVAHGLLARVVLPVGVGRKADRRVPGQPLLDASQMCGVQWQAALRPLDEVEQQHADDPEAEHGDGIANPALLLVFVDAADPVNRPFDGAQHRRKPGAVAAQDVIEIEANRFGQQQHEAKDNGDLDRSS